MDIKGFKGRDGAVHQYDFNALVNKPNTTSGADGGYYTPEVSQLDDNTIQFDFTPSKADMPAVESVQVKLPVSSDSTQNAVLYTAQSLTAAQQEQARENIGAVGIGQSCSGMSAAAAALLITILRAAVYPDGNDQSVNITALEAALASGEGSGDSGNTGNDETEVSFSQSGSVLTMSGVAAITSIVQTGSVLTMT